MKVTVLLENTASLPCFTAAHGLSILAESGGRSVLLDTGPDYSFVSNAAKLNADLSRVNCCILSHGHYDHADGLPAFRTLNPSAPIYARSTAMESYYTITESAPRYIGVQHTVATLPNIQFLKDDFVEIDRHLSVFSGVKHSHPSPSGNLTMRHKGPNGLTQDTFDHEQYTVFEENGNYYLFSGCAHNGILNILDRFRELYHCDPYAVISGFHMMKSTALTEEDEQLIRETGKKLADTKTIFYTGHCTGMPAYEILKDQLKDQLQAISTGLILHI